MITTMAFNSFPHLNQMQHLIVGRKQLAQNALRNNIRTFIQLGPI